MLSSSVKSGTVQRLVRDQDKMAGELESPGTESRRNEESRNHRKSIHEKKIRLQCFQKVCFASGSAVRPKK